MSSLHTLSACKKTTLLLSSAVATLVVVVIVFVVVVGSTIVVVVVRSDVGVAYRAAGDLSRSMLPPTRIDHVIAGSHRWFEIQLLKYLRVSCFYHIVSYYCIYAADAVRTYSIFSSFVC